MSEDTEIIDSGIRWLAVRFKTLKTLVVCALVPHGKQSVVAYRQTMHEFSLCLDRFFKQGSTHHSAVMGAGANVSLCGFVDGPRSMKKNAPLFLYDFLLAVHLRVDNTCVDDCTVTNTGWRHENRETQVHFLLSSEGTRPVHELCQ